MDKKPSRREFLADVHEQRLKNPQQFPKATINQNEIDMARQIQQYREKSKSKKIAKGRIVTLADLSNESAIPNTGPKESYNSISSFNDSQNLRARAFELVNYN
jgi:hypothetical protein